MSEGTSALRFIFIYSHNNLCMNCFLLALDVKRNAKGTPVWSLVYSLNNLANLYRVINDFSKANQLLKEAMRKLDEEDPPHRGAESLTYYTLGKVRLSQGKYQEACEMLEKAAEKYKGICEDGPAHVETLMHLAKAQQKNGNNKIAIRQSKTILKISEAINKAIPTNTFISDTLEVLVDAYRSMGKTDMVKVTLEKLHSEQIRLERIHMASGNTRRVNDIMTRLSDICLSLRLLK